MKIGGRRGVRKKNLMRILFYGLNWFLCCFCSIFLVKSPLVVAFLQLKMKSLNFLNALRSEIKVDGMDYLGTVSTRSQTHLGTDVYNIPAFLLGILERVYAQELL